MKKVLAVIALGLLTSAPAYAESYIGIAGGRSLWSGKSAVVADALGYTGISDTSVHQDRTNFAGRLFVGTWQGTYGLELGYAYLGKTTFSVSSQTFTASDKVEQENQAIYIDMLGGAYVTDALRVYGKLGLYGAIGKVKDSGVSEGVGYSFSGDTSNGGVHAGVGVDYSISDHLTLKFSIENFFRGGKGVVSDNASNKIQIGTFNIITATGGIAYMY